MNKIVQSFTQQNKVEKTPLNLFKRKHLTYLSTYVRTYVFPNIQDHHVSHYFTVIRSTVLSRERKIDSIMHSRCTIPLPYYGREKKQIFFNLPNTLRTVHYLLLVSYLILSNLILPYRTVR